MPSWSVLKRKVLFRIFTRRPKKIIPFWKLNLPIRTKSPKYSMLNGFPSSPGECIWGSETFIKSGAGRGGNFDSLHAQGNFIRTRGPAGTGRRGSAVQTLVV